MTLTKVREREREKENVKTVTIIQIVYVILCQFITFYMYFFLENNMRPNSSSEDGLGQVFSSEVRRSKRYMSKRTSGTFREYLNSRNIELAFNDESFNRSPENSQSTPTQTMEQMMEHKPIIENKTKDGFMRKGSMRRSTKSVVAINCDKNGNKLSDKIDNKITAKSNGTEPNSRRAFHDIEVSVNNQHTAKSVSGANNSFFKKYDNDVSKPKNPQFESNDDWYASASDMDDSDGAVSKPYGYNAVNPVLECVNQVSISTCTTSLFFSIPMGFHLKNIIAFYSFSLSHFRSYYSNQWME